MLLAYVRSMSPGPRALLAKIPYSAPGESPGSKKVDVAERKRPR
jgi:hypothetical protein